MAQNLPDQAVQSTSRPRSTVYMAAGALLFIALLATGVTVAIMMAIPSDSSVVIRSAGLTSSLSGGAAVFYLVFRQFRETFCEFTREFSRLLPIIVFGPLLLGAIVLTMDERTNAGVETCMAAAPTTSSWPSKLMPEAGIVGSGVDASECDERISALVALERASPQVARTLFLKVFGWELTGADEDCRRLLRRLLLETRSENQVRAIGAELGVGPMTGDSQTGEPPRPSSSEPVGPSEWPGTPLVR